MESPKLTMDNAAQLAAVNGQLKKGEVWVGYRYSASKGGEKVPSKFLYFAFYQGGTQKFVNTKTNDPEATYRQLLEARGRARPTATALRGRPRSLPGKFQQKLRRYEGLKPHDFPRSCARNLTLAGADRRTAVKNHRPQNCLHRANVNAK
jgi:hypothetical protein